VIGCADVARLVTAFVDGELDLGRGSAVRGHARTCADCAALIEAEARVRQTATELDVVDPPPSLWGRIEARLAAEETRDARRSRLWLWWQGARTPAWTGIVAATAAFVLALWLVGDRRVPTEADSARRQPAAGADAAVVVGVAGPGAGADHSERVRAEIARADERYVTVIDELRRAVADERAGWSPAQTAAIDVRLTELEAQAAQQRAAAAGSDDPAERDDLHRTYRAEIALLQDAVLGADEAWGGRP
jgi:hypothetical protein